jgi:hypothetical protein
MPTPKVNSWLGWRNFTVNIRTEVRGGSWLTKSPVLGACRFDLDVESEEEGERVKVVCSPGTRTKGDERNLAGGGGARRTAAGSIPRRRRRSGAPPVMAWGTMSSWQHEEVCGRVSFAWRATHPVNRRRGAGGGARLGAAPCCDTLRRRGRGDSSSRVVGLGHARPRAPPFIGRGSQPWRAGNGRREAVASLWPWRPRLLWWASPACSWAGWIGSGFADAGLAQNDRIGFHYCFS